VGKGFCFLVRADGIHRQLPVELPEVLHMQFRYLVQSTRPITDS
jgi:hypothetical protein